MGEFLMGIAVGMIFVIAAWEFDRHIWKRAYDHERLKGSMWRHIAIDRQERLSDING